MTDALDAPYPLTPRQIADYRRDGFIKLKHVLPPEVLAEYGAEITRQVHALNTQHLPMEQRSTYQKAFLQVMNLWTHSPDVQRFVMGRRLGGIAAALMGTAGVRLYHDQALYKEPGGGITPWHADQYYWPLASDAVCTAWIPLQPTPLDMGPLAFSVASHRFAAGRGLPDQRRERAEDQQGAARRGPADRRNPL